MLRLLQSPQWTTGDARHDLPATLPGGIIVFLALHADWASRDRLQTLLWPDASAAEAQHSLRVNLHRVRQLLAQWGCETALHAERRRVRLDLPCDVADLRAALAAGDAERAFTLYRRPLLDGQGFPGFPVLQEWLDFERADLHERWRAAMLRRVQAPDVAPSAALETTQHLLALDPLDEDALAARLRILCAQGREADAQRQYAAFGARIAADLAVEPGAALRDAARSLGLVPAAPATGVDAPAAARDAFVGRATELAQVQAVLEQPGVRLVVLVGPGGVGKSRLARELALRMAPHVRDGCRWVALGDAVDAESALARVAAALGLALSPSVPVRDQVARALARSCAVIVCDGVEQIAGFPTALAALLAAAPDVRWIATSHAPLGVPGERTFALEGLAHPDPGPRPSSVDAARAFDGLRLLEARVRAFAPDFDLAAQLDDCLRLLERIGGWPLAIEIAATVLATQPAATVLADLGETLDTLTAAAPQGQARHASVRASLALSWRLLAPAQRQALSRLAVFAGGFTRSAALDVIQADPAALSALVERLLVQVAGGGRYQLHPLVAQFALEQLAATPDGERQARERHAAHFLRQLSRFGDREHVDAASAARAIEADFENFRTAWQWTIATAGAAALEPAPQAWTHFCNVKGRAREVASLVEPALADARLPPASRAGLLRVVANARYRSGEIDTAIALGREAVDAGRAAGDGPGERAAANVLALALIQRSQADEAAHVAFGALAAAEAAGADDEVADIANTCAIVARFRGDFAGAEAYYRSAIAVHRRRGNQRSLALCLNNLGNVQRSMGDFPAARDTLEECLRVCEQHDIASTRSFALGNLGIVAHAMGRLDAADLYADRTLAEPAAEPAIKLGARGLQTLVALDRRDQPRAAELVRTLAREARTVGLHGALLLAIACHAQLLIQLGQRGAAAERLTYIIDHPKAAAMERSDATATRDAMQLTGEELAAAVARARGLDLDVLLESAARAEAAATHAAGTAPGLPTNA
ncbi:MAG: tetratricopeptide repeat protein [Burkholderiales bacterium]